MLGRIRGIRAFTKHSLLCWPWRHHPIAQFQCYGRILSERLTLWCPRYHIWYWMFQKFYLQPDQPEMFYSPVNLKWYILLATWWQNLLIIISQPLTRWPWENSVRAFVRSGWEGGNQSIILWCFKDRFWNFMCHTCSWCPSAHCKWVWCVLSVSKREK